MTRKDALLKLQNKPYDTETIKNDFEYISNKLSIDVSELKKYFQMPKKLIKIINLRAYLQFRCYRNENVRFRKGRKKMIGVIDYSLGNMSIF